MMYNDYKRYLWELVQFGNMIQHKGVYTSEDKAVCEFACYLVKASYTPECKLYRGRVSILHGAEDLSKARSYLEFNSVFKSYKPVFELELTED